jgi:2-phosphoglycolate phosphatase
MIRAVLFDLDGTVADTAPDLGYAVNCMRQTRGLPPLPASATRPVASMGARGLLNVAFGMDPEHPDYGAMREEFLRLYERHICRETRLFPGMYELLEALGSRELRWGIVTNKAERLARLLLGRLELPSPPACVVGGDTTPHFKPHPEPLLTACRLIGVAPATCVYVGDDQRDVEAGRAAGMPTAVAGWGYLNGAAPETWNAEWLLRQPGHLLAHLRCAPP